MWKTPLKHFGHNIALVAASLYLHAGSQAQTTELGDNFHLINGDARWLLLEKIPLQFNTYHPQGLVKVGQHFFLSSVETTEQPQVLSESDSNSGYDRSPGAGVAHLFKFDDAGNLLDQITLGENNFYHPGGIDSDGEAIWISVAEYRPESHSIIYRIDPETLEAEEVLRFDDYLGAIIHDSQKSTLYAVNWGSKYHYSWRAVDGVYAADEFTRTRARGSNIEYQDCQYLPTSLMLCSGIGDYSIDNTHTFTIGGIELVNLDSKQIEHRITLTNTTETGEFLVRNSSYFEFQSLGKSNFYFVPEDNHSSLYKYAVESTP
ncbi:MAG: hypothetical protein HQ498_08620 [Pseudohongiella sp.]|nr:hypothetical protein [Pseudohongiella sp.]